MLKIQRKLPPGSSAPAQLELVLPFAERSKSRLRVTLASGEDAGVILERGSVLRDGDLLVADDGRVVRVRARAESCSTVHASDAWALTRAAYHLGNRHVALQIGAGWLRYCHDHVLDDMVRGFGLAVTTEEVPFEPESGAYASASHSHSHGHDHSHD